MSFSTEWEQCFQSGTNMSVWPWSDLISYVMRYSPLNNIEFNVLEVGCGAGANIPFFKKMGVNYYAIEGSSTIVSKLWDRFPELKNNIIVGDFTKEIPFDIKFDLIVDRSAITHNSTNAIKNTLSLIYTKLIKNGKYIGIDWFSDVHSDRLKGVIEEDNYTRGNFTDGQFSDVGQVHFSDKRHLMELFEDFSILVMEHKIVKREIPDDGLNFASWNLVAQKI